LPRPTRRASFGRFVQALGAHFRTQVSNWSIWNEPNLSTFLGPQYVHGRAYSPKLYRRLYQAASGALKRSVNGATGPGRVALDRRVARP
jgi:beta-glucosidase/6-phospho-beta-glucosidase/beta-galactosidase